MRQVGIHPNVFLSQALGLCCDGLAQKKGLQSGDCAPFSACLHKARARIVYAYSIFVCSPATANLFRPALKQRLFGVKQFNGFLFGGGEPGYGQVG